MGGAAIAGYGVGVLRWLTAVLGFRYPDPESVAHLRTMGAQLTDAAGSLRAIASRARLLNERVEALKSDAAAWERRIPIAAQSKNHELVIAAARMAGRVQGQLDAAQTELRGSLTEEIALRDTLIEMRAKWLRMLDAVQRMGHDVSGCMTTIDLSVPPPPDDACLPDDEEREFVARIIDRMNVR